MIQRLITFISAQINAYTIVADILLIASEVILLIILFTLVNLLVKLIFKCVKSLPLISKLESRLSTIQFNIRSVLIVLCILGSLSIIAYNAFLIWRGVPLVAYHFKLASKIPIETWQNFAISLIKVFAVVIAATIAIRFISRVLNKLERKAKDWEKIRANDQSITVLFATLYHIISNGLWLLVFTYAVWTLPYLSFLSIYLLLLLKVYLIISLGMLLVSSVAVVVDSLDALSQKYASPDNLLRFYEHLKGLVPLLRRCLEYVIYVGVATLVIMQVEFVSGLAKWGPSIIQVIGLFFLARVFVVIAELLVDSNLLKADQPSEIELQRQATIRPLLKSLLKYSIYFVAFVLMVRAFNINPTAILAGAGIVGIVVGLGAQPLINDLVSGFFILFENIYLVGDYIETGTARGIVEGIDIRATRIRDPNGQLHILRNGQLNDVINYSKKYTHAVVEVGVAYDSDLNKVYRVLRETGAKLNESNEAVLEETQVSGLDNFGESELLIRTTTRVKPGCHLEVARDLRKRIKEAFDNEKIEIPFARRVVIFKNQPAEL